MLHITLLTLLTLVRSVVCFDQLLGARHTRISYHDNVHLSGFAHFFLLLSCTPKGVVPQVLETGCKTILLMLLIHFFLQCLEVKMQIYLNDFPHLNHQPNLQIGFNCETHYFTSKF